LRIGLVENTKKNAEEVLRKLTEKLAAAYGMIAPVLVSLRIARNRWRPDHACEKQTRKDQLCGRRRHLDANRHGTAQSDGRHRSCADSVSGHGPGSARGFERGSIGCHGADHVAAAARQGRIARSGDLKRAADSIIAGSADHFRIRRARFRDLSVVRGFRSEQDAAGHRRPP
jgi:hypothetical protein